MRKPLGKVGEAIARSFLHTILLSLEASLALFTAQHAYGQALSPWVLDQVVTNSGNGGPVTAPTVTPSQPNEEAFLIIAGDYGGAETSETGPCNPEVETYLTGISPPWSSVTLPYNANTPGEIGSISILPGALYNTQPFSYWASTTAPISTSATVPWDTACILNDDWGTILALVKFTEGVPISGPVIAGQFAGSAPASQITNLSGWNFGSEPTFLVGYISWRDLTSIGDVTLSDPAGNSYQMIANVGTSSGCAPGSSEPNYSPPYCINSGTGMQMFISPNYVNPSGIVTVTVTSSSSAAGIAAVALGPVCTSVPSIASISPGAWIAGSVYSVTITGTNFTSNSVAMAGCAATPVSISTPSGTVVALSNVTVVSATQITATVAPPAGEPTETATVTVGTAPNTAAATVQIMGDTNGTCLAALATAHKNRAALKRAENQWSVLQAAADAHDIDPALLAAIAVRETGFMNVPERLPNGKEGPGMGYFQLTHQPGVTQAQAYDLTFAANYAANMLSVNENYLSSQFPAFTPDQLLQATAASYNLGKSGISGNPNSIDVGSAPGGINGNYGSNVMGLMSCFANQ